MTNPDAKMHLARNLPYAHCASCTGKADEEDCFVIDVGHIVSLAGHALHTKFGICRDCFNRYFPWLMTDIEAQGWDEQGPPSYPNGETMPCYRCRPVEGIQRLIVELGPVVNPADPTQSYRLECGHLMI